LQTKNEKIVSLFEEYLDKNDMDSIVKELPKLLKSFVKIDSRMNKIIKQSDNQQLEMLRLKEIEEQTNEKISILLNNAGQGFLYFNKDMIIGKEYSSEVKKIFKKDISDTNITQLLIEDKDDSLFLESTLKDILESDEMTQEILISLLQSEFKIHDAYITIEYKVLDKENFMMILTDITKNKELAQKIKDEQQVLKMVVETVTTMEQFLSVKKDYESFIYKIESYKDIDKLSDMRKEIHTYKGLFAQKEMLNVVKELHEFESLVDTSLKVKKIDKKILNITTKEMNSWLEKDIQVLMGILGEDFFDKSDSIIIDKNRIENLQEQVKNYLKNKDEKYLICLDKNIEELNYSNIITFLKPYEALVEQLATRLEKTINPLVINSEDIYISDKYKPFLNSLVHIFRNSIDHGIETDEDREISGKEDIGTITCDVIKKENNIVIKISDDGTGIDEDKIKSLAVSKGIYTQKEVDLLTKDEVLLIIFKDAFSTSQNITDISGRGVGLASLIQELEKLNGTMKIENNFSKGIAFTFTIQYEDIS